MKAGPEGGGKPKFMLMKYEKMETILCKNVESYYIIVCKNKAQKQPATKHSGL